MNIRPVGKRVVVQPEEQPLTTKLGIHIVPSDDRRDTGVVVAISDNLDEDIKVGDKVIYAKYAGQVVKVEGQEVVIHHQSDIWAVIEE